MDIQSGRLAMLEGCNCGTVVDLWRKRAYGEEDNKGNQLDQRQTEGIKVIALKRNYPLS